MTPPKPPNPFGPLVVPLALLVGFAYVHTMGYTSESAEPLHRAFAFFFELNIATLGAALGVSVWAVYAVQLNLRRRGNVPPFAPLAAQLAKRLELGTAEPALEHLAQIARRLTETPLPDEQRPGLAAELGSFLGEALARGRGARWDQRSDPELGPFAYQASTVLLPQPDGPPLQINVYSVALRALQDPAELVRFAAQLDTLG
jgi:hypothetical protein